MDSSSTQPSILGEGPYVWNVVHDHVESTRPSGHQGHTRPVKLPLTITVPMAPSSASTAPPGPFPVCVLLNGFQARASYYAPLARRLASWGVVVLQYNAPALTIIPDASELPFLGVAVEWLKKAVHSESAQPALQGRADLDKLVLAGHSRGGKLAALHYSSGEVCGLPIRTAFLIDPVDNTSFTPESADYPSASKALRAAGKPFGLAAAGIVGSSNPEGSNYKVFEAAAPAGSWTFVLKHAGHTTFMKPPTGVETWLLDRVFGGGKMSRDLAISQTAAAMLAWFQSQLSAPSSSSSSNSKNSGGPDAVQAAAAAAHVPLASVGLNAAAMTAAAPATAAAAGEESKVSEEEQQFGQKLESSFMGWVTTPLPQQEVEFTVKGKAA